MNKGTPSDELELERWSMELQEIYHLDVHPFWRDDMTL
jgi:hypothetical protein